MSQYKKEKPLFITIDTEGDNYWNSREPNEVTTENVRYIPRFQGLCEEYGFIPIWLTNYEVIRDKRYVSYIKRKQEQGLCEVGIHPHAVNTPPLYSLRETDSVHAYLIEYPVEIMHEKLRNLKLYIEECMEHKVVSHRAGRWALNQDYVNILCEEHILYDCSVTPGINWSQHSGMTRDSKGSDYTDLKRGRQVLFHQEGLDKVIEFPVSIYDAEKIFLSDRVSPVNFAKSIYHFVKKRKIWLRPNHLGNLAEMKYILQRVMDSDEEYAEFMIHSSELMPGGSPSFRTEADINRMLNMVERLFLYANKVGFKGYTFETWESYKKLKENEMEKESLRAL